MSKIKSFTIWSCTIYSFIGSCTIWLWFCPSFEPRGRAVFKCFYVIAIFFTLHKCTVRGEPGGEVRGRNKKQDGKKDYPRAAALWLFASGRGECGLQESDDKYK